MVDADQGEIAEIDATIEVEVAPKNDRFVGAAVPRRRQGGAAAPSSNGGKAEQRHVVTHEIV